MADLKPKPPATAWGAAFERALQSGMSVVIGVVGGYYADRWLGTRPVFVFVGLLLGVIAGFRALLQIQWPEPPEDSTPGSGADSGAARSGAVGSSAPTQTRSADSLDDWDSDESDDPWNDREEE